MEVHNNTFHWLDYVVFALMLALSAAIGIFYAWRDKKKQTTENFLLGDRSMSVPVVTMSILASFLSAISILGLPTEIYFNGTMYIVDVFSAVIVFPVTAHAIIPVFHNLRLTSAYEYLERRFDFTVRVTGSLIFQLQMVLYMSLVLYAPAMAINQVMGINIYISILGIGAVCTFYTAIGGLKAVMWTDMFQMLVVLGGLIAVIAKGSVESGGAAYVWETANNGNKIQFWNFDPNPEVRHTFWGLVIGGATIRMTLYAANQALIQRYLSMKTLRQAQISVYLQLPGSLLVTGVLAYAGLILYARYHDNDPIDNCLIDKPSQMIPWLVMDILGEYHGFPGLLVACLFGAALSTISSGVNALALVSLVDIIKPVYKRRTGRTMEERSATMLSKFLALAYGIVTIGIAFLAQFFGPLMVQVANSIFGMVGGPLLGLFVGAMFFPVINPWGAIAGIITSLGITCWIAIGAILRPNGNTSAVDCGALGNITVTTEPTTTSVVTMDTGAPEVLDSDNSVLDHMYRISYMWYSVIAVIIAVVVGIVVSCVTGGTVKKPVDPELLSPLYLCVIRRSSVKNYDTCISDDNSKSQLSSAKLEKKEGLTNYEDGGRRSTRL